MHNDPLDGAAPTRTDQPDPTDQSDPTRHSIELPRFIRDEYLLARPTDDGENWIGIRILLGGRGRIVRGPIANAWSAGVPDGW
jgi:hypothetical protein